MYLYLDYIKQQEKVEKGVHIYENNHRTLTDGMLLINFAYGEELIFQCMHIVDMYVSSC